MSDVIADTPAEQASRHPIRLVVTDDLRRSRLTVLLRLVLALPHLVWWSLWGLAVLVVSFAGWIVALVTGRLPDALHDFLAAYLRYTTHVYAYLGIVADPFPSFTGAPGYPVDADVDPPAPQSRLTVFFRILLAIPALVVTGVLQYLFEIVAVLAWFYALFTGRTSKGMRDLQVYCLRYQAQTYGYVWLLTGRYPSFGD
jgi:hypothetical protein